MKTFAPSTCLFFLYIHFNGCLCLTEQKLWVLFMCYLNFAANSQETYMNFEMIVSLLFPPLLNWLRGLLNELR